MWTADVTNVLVGALGGSCEEDGPNKQYGKLHQDPSLATLVSILSNFTRNTTYIKGNHICSVLLASINSMQTLDAR